MAYQVIARRWRPQTFDQLVYQEHITRTLKNSIARGRISHSYLFTGTRGVGKTTTARILAKSLNCVDGPTPDPCGICENCTEIKNGNSFDVMEIDGASNNSVENIRELRETVHFAPVKSRFKIYIIDEVHMLSTSAFNALLKTLEEPPPHTIFIFATTEIHKVPDTILSRCQKYYFKKITPEAIVGHLRTIVGKEESTVPDDTLYAIARAATGSMRDAQSLLEQVIAFSDDNAGSEAVATLLGIVPLQSYTRILDAVRNNTPQVLIDEVHAVTGSGADISRYVDGFIQTLRALRMQKHGITVNASLGYSPDELALLNERAAQFADEELSALFSVCAELTGQLRSAEHEDIYLEMALIDMASLVSRPSISAIIEKLESAAPESESETEKKNTPAHDTAERERGPAHLNTRQAWQEFLRTIPIHKRYMHEKCEQFTPAFFDHGVRLAPKDSTGILLDAQEKEYIQRELSRLCGGQIRVYLDTPDTEEIPPPNEPPGTTVHTTEETVLPPTVSKVMEIFHGKIVTKGDN